MHKNSWHEAAVCCKETEASGYISVPGACPHLLCLGAVAWYLGRFLLARPSSPSSSGGVLVLGDELREPPDVEGVEVRAGELYLPGLGLRGRLAGLLCLLNLASSRYAGLARRRTGLGSLGLQSGS